MLKYNIINNLSKEFDLDIPDETIWSVVNVYKELVSNLAKNQIIDDLINQRDSFIEITDNKIDQIRSVLIDFDLKTWMKFKNSKELFSGCSYQQEMVILKDSEKLDILNNMVWQSVSKITVREWACDSIYLDASLDWIDSDWEGDEFDYTPLLFFLPNFVLSDWWNIEMCDNHLLDIYMDDIKEIIFEGVRYKFLNI